VYLVFITSRGRERIFLMLTSFINLLILVRLTVPLVKFCFIWVLRSTKNYRLLVFWAFFHSGDHGSLPLNIYLSLDAVSFIILVVCVFTLRNNSILSWLRYPTRILSSASNLGGMPSFLI